jgi:hypothetical protein
MAVVEPAPRFEPVSATRSVLARLREEAARLRLSRFESLKELPPSEENCEHVERFVAA